jgi:LEA14-like dessication related protein
MKKCYLLFLPLVILCLTCKSVPPAVEPPVSLVFDHAQAENLNKVIIFYRLLIENPRPVPLNLNIRKWNIIVNGIDLNTVDPDRKGLVLNAGESSAEDALISVAAGESTEVLLSLELDLWLFHGSGRLPGTTDISADYRARLGMDLSWRYEKEKPGACTVQAEAVFPRIQEPEFTITAIAILQAELVNTRFRVTLRIDNPNVFPVDLFSFGYKLYGEGRFWADGTEKDVLHVPAHGSAETNLFLVMNFIDMKRSLLDEVIAMNQVRYRFAGELEVGTGVTYLPKFHMEFDRNGNSVVLK